MWEKNLDLGCIDNKMSANSSANSLNSADSNGSSSIASKSSKNKSAKGSPPSGGVNALNRVSSQIKKPAHRKTSPVNWSSRQKVESYLQRKIRLLQEAGGMNDTLDETLSHSNLHHCRVLREKIALKEAACRVMEARKAAMVEASWCRILQAARIPHKDAEDLLLKAEKEVDEALQAAEAKGVIMYDTSDRPQKVLEIETSSASGKGFTTHTVRASFETVFEVDKQVASAVKTAFIKLAHSSSFNKDEFKDLVRKISENPDAQELSEFETSLEGCTVTCNSGSNSGRKNRKKLSPQKFNGAKLTNLMLQRIKCLKDEELASLAMIVATCGLNAALARTESHNRVHDRISESSMNGTVRAIQAESGLPSLDKFLVKKITKLEKEAQEAKNARKVDRDGDRKHDSPQNHSCNGDNKLASAADVSDLGSIQFEHKSTLEKEVEEATRIQKASEMDRPKLGRTVKHNNGRQLGQDDPELPSLDKFLVKRVTRLEREVQEANNRLKNDSCTSTTDENSNMSSTVENHREKENVHLNRTVASEMQQNEKLDSARKVVREDEVLEKQLHNGYESQDRSYKKQGIGNNTEWESLDKYLVKHVSKLEKEKMKHAAIEGLELKKRDTAQAAQVVDTTASGLDQILVKHRSRLEREKTDASQPPEDGKKYSVSRREARERELLESWGGIGLGGCTRPHISRLQRDKVAWIKAEEEGKKRSDAEASTASLIR